MAEKVLEVESADATARLAARLGEHVVAGDLFDLRGTLGAGKTAFVRGLAAGLGVSHGVASPTFTICREYAGRLQLFHIDAYRLTEPRELLLHGWDEMRSRGVVAVEWGERAEELMPADRIVVTIDHLGATTRRFHFRCDGGAADRLWPQLLDPGA